MMRFRAMTLVSAAAAGVLTLTGGAATAAPASVHIGPADLSCTPFRSAPFKLGNAVVVIGEWVCANPDNPRDGQPLPVGLQRQRSNGTWETLDTGDGEARHTCQNTSTRNYRNSRNTAQERVITCP